MALSNFQSSQGLSHCQMTGFYDLHGRSTWVDTARHCSIILAWPFPVMLPGLPVSSGSMKGSMKINFRIDDRRASGQSFQIGTIFIETSLKHPWNVSKRGSGPGKGPLPFLIRACSNNLLRLSGALIHCIMHKVVVQIVMVISPQALHQRSSSANQYDQIWSVCKFYKIKHASNYHTNPYNTFHYHFCHIFSLY